MKKIASVDERIRTRVSGSKVRRSNHQTTRPKTFLSRKKWYIKEKCILLLKPSTINLQFNFLKGPSIEYFKLNIFQTSMNQAFRKCIATFWALKLRLCYYSQGNCGLTGASLDSYFSTSLHRSLASLISLQCWISAKVSFI